MAAIELQVLPDAPVALDVRDGPAARWGSAEYVPMVVSDLPEYEGPYTTTPTWAAQTFATANHAMRDDFSVREIQKLEAPNDAGGLTLTI